MTQVDEIKQKLSIVDVVGEQVELRQLGRNWKGLCPFHSEKTPSFMVNEDLRIYKCFGCGKGGDIFSFVMEIEGLDFTEALEKLAEKAGIKLEKKGYKSKSARQGLFEVNTLACEYYHFLLTEHKVGEKAREYLKSRKINTRLMKSFKLGYALNTWRGLKDFMVNKKEFDESLLLKAGLLTEGGRGSYDRFRGRLIFPFFDNIGRVVGFAGRQIPGVNENGPKYINSPETDIYHKSETFFGFSVAREAIRKKRKAVLVEGPMDAISSYGAGVTETVAINGTALTKEMFTVLARLCDEVLLAFDADSAGEGAIKRAVSIAESLGVRVKIIELPNGKDPDEMARSNAKQWKRVVSSAVEVYEFVTDKAFEKYGDEEGAVLVSAVSTEVLPYLLKIENKMVQSHWVRKLALRLGVGEDSIWMEMERLRRQDKLVKKTEEKKDKIVIKKTRLERFLREFLSVFFALDEGERSKFISENKEIDWGCLSELVKSLFVFKGMNEAWIESLSVEYRELVREAYLLIDNGVRADWRRLVAELREEILRDERKSMVGIIKELEKKGDEKELRKVTARFVSRPNLE